jgi:hypothetical protein
MKNGSNGAQLYQCRGEGDEMKNKKIKKIFTKTEHTSAGLPERF